MLYIDEKFKDSDPKATVERIKGILDELGIEVRENWNDSGIENCHSASVQAVAGLPITNGKGITKDFALARYIFLV